MTSLHQNITVSIDNVVFGYSKGKLHLLLIKREKEPFKDRWALPGGLLDTASTAKNKAIEILKTKAGVNIDFLEQLYTFDEMERDPRSRTISLSYFAFVNTNHYEISVESKSNDAKWFSLTNLPKLAFDHSKIISKAIERIQNKIEYHPLGFELLPEEFTLSELQELYQVILGRELDKRNFRKKILSTGIVVATGKKKIGGRNRQPELYRFNESEYKILLKNGFNIKIV